MTLIVLFLSSVLYILLIAIFIKVLVSWLPMAGIHVDQGNPFFRLIDSITNPILDPLRQYTAVGMLDFSPMIALFIIITILQILQAFQ